MFGIFKRNKPSQDEMIQIILDADQNIPQALLDLTGLYRDFGMTDSKKHSLRKLGYAPLAEAGDVNAQLWLGKLAVLDDDGETAEGWFLRGAAQNNTEAMLQLSLGYATYNQCSFGEDLEKSFQWVLKAAELGNPDGQCQVAMEYLSGETVEQSPELALQWYQKAAQQNYPEALFALGEFYGDSAPENTHYDADTSRQYYLKAMETRDKIVCVKSDPRLALYFGGEFLREQTDSLSPELAEKTMYWLCQAFWFGDRSALPMLRRLSDELNFTVSEDQSKEWRYHFRSPEDDED